MTKKQEAEAAERKAATRRAASAAYRARKKEAGLTDRNFLLTDAEFEVVKAFVEQLRAKRDGQIYSKIIDLSALPAQKRQG